MAAFDDLNFFCKKSSMVIAGPDSNYASAYDMSFYWKDFSSRLYLIKANTMLNSGFNKVSTWIYFLRREIKRDIVQIGFSVLLKTWYYHLYV